MFGKNKALWGNAPFKPAYDAVIVGGGVHGLATAYYLARDYGMKNIAVVEKRHVGFGGTGRNTAIISSNQRTGENLLLHDEGLKLWPKLSEELDFNLMFHKCGILDLAHSEDALANMRLKVASAKFMGIESEIRDAKGCGELVSALDISDRPRYPIMGGMYHPPGGTVRHDAVAWGLARGAAKLGVHIHQGTQVSGIGIEKGRVVSVETDKGTIHTPTVLNAAGTYSPLISDMAGIRLPVEVLSVQAMVTQPLRPMLRHIVSSDEYRCYANQTLKGEIAMGADMGTWPNHTKQITAHYIRYQAEAITELLPCLRGVKFMRAWAGLADMTWDMAPITDGNDHVEGYYMDCGWGSFGFKSGVVAGKYMAEFMALKIYPRILRPFTLRRFENYCLSGEAGKPVYYGPWN